MSERHAQQTAESGTLKLSWQAQASATTSHQSAHRALGVLLPTSLSVTLSLCCCCLGLAPVSRYVTGVLLPCERTWLLAQPHKPLAVGQAMSVILQATDLDTQTKATVDKTISTFTYEFGACNRIYNTSIPAAYTRWGVSVLSRCA